MNFGSARMGDEWAYPVYGGFRLLSSCVRAEHRLIASCHRGRSVWAVEDRVHGGVVSMLRHLAHTHTVATLCSDPPVHRELEP